MMRGLFPLALSCFFVAGGLVPVRAGVVDDVNPFIGTAGGGTEYGGMMPQVQPPFAMTSWVAQTRQSGIGATSYAYEDATVSGFIGTHQPALWMGDYGYVTLMPEVGDVKTTPTARRLPFSHDREKATPYLYTVTLGADSAHRIRAALTATDHCALLRFRFSVDAANPGVLVEATRPGVAGWVKVDRAAGEITGYNPDRMDAKYGPCALPNFKGYFVVQFQPTMTRSGVYAETAVQADGTEIAGDNVGAYAGFDHVNGGRIEARVGTSFISLDQARENLRAEIPDWDFDRLRDALRDTWERKLGLLAIEGANDDARKVFYTAMYHALLYPRLFSEGGRYYSAFDDAVHEGVSYTAFSLWDTFRAENSFLTLVAPERIDGMVNALLQDYREGGWMPKWPNPSYTNIMIGTHADSLVAEAIQKGFHGFDYNVAYEAVRKDATVPPDDDAKHRWRDREEHTPYEARGGLAYALPLGYIPTDKTAEAASRTLEDAYDDWCVAQVARAVGKTDDEQHFLERSKNYRHLYNPAIHGMQGKKADGSWAGLLDGWTEGDTWAYSFSALHDIPGLIALMGGPDAFNRKLYQHFSGGHNNHTNEPCHHCGYLFDYSGRPWDTQRAVRQIARSNYFNTPDGLTGNDDCGQMSAWYLFTALGFYPVNPASGEYMIGSPLFTRATLTTASGRRFTVSAPGNSAANIFIQSATLDGQPLEHPVLTHAQITAGGTLELTMGPRPSPWGAKP